MIPTTEYIERYKQAHAAYCQGNLEEANKIINQMSEQYPDDANILLLQGHINVRLQNCELAQEYYQAVLSIADSSELRDYALQGLAQIQQTEGTKELKEVNLESTDEHISNQGQQQQFSEDESLDFISWAPDEDSGTSSWGTPSEIDWDSSIFSDDESGEPTIGSKPGNNKYSNEQEEESIFADSPRVYNTNNPIKNSRIENPEAPPEQTGNKNFILRENPNPENIGIVESSTFIVSSELSQDNTGALNINNNSEFNFDQTETGEDSFLKHLDSLDPNELENISRFDITDISKGLPESNLFGDRSEKLGSEALLTQDATTMTNEITDYLEDTSQPQGSKSELWIKPTPEVNQGKLAWFKNASLRRKQWITAVLAGVAPMLTIILITLIASATQPKRPTVRTGTTPNVTRIERNNSLSLANP